MSKHPLALVAAAFLGALAARTLDAFPAAAQSRGLTFSGSCDRGDVVVFDDGSHLRCADADELELLACDSDELLGTDSSGRLRCVGPSTSSWGARGLLPSCSSGDTLVSEGFGSWRCQPR